MAGTSASLSKRFITPLNLVDGGGGAVIKPSKILPEKGDLPSALAFITESLTAFKLLPCNLKDGTVAILSKALQGILEKGSGEESQIETFSATRITITTFLASCTAAQGGSLEILEQVQGKLPARFSAGLLTFGPFREIEKAWGILNFQNLIRIRKICKGTGKLLDVKEGISSRSYAVVRIN